MCVFSYAGTFEVSSGSIIISDPYVNDISVAAEVLPFSNEKRIRATNVVNGIYDAYHQVSDSGDVIQLICIHNAFDLDFIKSATSKNMGKVVSSMGNSISCVDEVYYQNSSFCYYQISESAYYSPEKVLSSIPLMPYAKEKCNMISELMNSHIEQGTFPKGKEILDIIGCEPIWPGFRDFNMDCSQWSAEIVDRLYATFTNSISVKGGIVTKAPAGEFSCHSFSNSSDMIYCIAIDLV